MPRPPEGEAAPTPAAPRPAPAERPPAFLAELPPLHIPEPAEVGYFTTLKFALGAPRRFFDALSPSSPVRTGVRFGFVSALVGILGTAVKGWLTEPVPPRVEGLETLTPEMRRMMACALEQQTAWDALVEPYLLARLPLAPVLAMLLVYGLAALFHVMARAIGNRETPLPQAARNLGYALAPLALSALPLMAFGGCFIWSLILCGISLKRSYGVGTLVAGLMAAFPFFLWMMLELLVLVRLALPCMPSP